METLVASKDISNPLQGGIPTISSDFPATASSSEGCGTATTIEMDVGKNDEGHDSSQEALNDKTDLKNSDSVSVSSTAASKYKNVYDIFIQNTCT